MSRTHLHACSTQLPPGHSSALGTLGGWTPSEKGWGRAPRRPRTQTRGWLNREYSSPRDLACGLEGGSAPWVDTFARGKDSWRRAIAGPWGVRPRDGCSPSKSWEQGCGGGLPPVTLGHLRWTGVSKYEKITYIVTNIFTKSYYIRKAVTESGQDKWRHFYDAGRLETSFQVLSFGRRTIVACYPEQKRLAAARFWQNRKWFPGRRGRTTSKGYGSKGERKKVWNLQKPQNIVLICLLLEMKRRKLFIKTLPKAAILIGIKEISQNYE